MKNKLMRFARAKGHGVHSPFAYSLITNVLCSSYSYNAFFDIADLLRLNEVPSQISPFNYLSFRLVNHFHPKRILEIGTGNGINTLFLTSPHSNVECVCFESDKQKADQATKLLLQYDKKASSVSGWSQICDKKFDAIFVDMENELFDDMDKLLSISNLHTFLVFHKKKIKPLRQMLVKDGRLNVIFDMKHICIAFLDPNYCRHIYYI